LLFATQAQAATLYISPSNTNVSVGNIIPVKILVNTSGQSINNVDTVIKFPTDLLEVMSISKSSSIFSLWVEEPGFSNTLGQITINGGIPNPGYIGQSGEIASVILRAKNTGTASLVFADSAVRLNDGLGTNSLTGVQSSNIQITSKVIEVQNDVENTRLPSRPIITSSTNPNQDAWYADTTASFTWNVQPNITSIQTLLSKNQSAIPTVTYDNTVSQRTVNNISDGVYYFSVRYMNSAGWGPITRYKIQIDSTPPDKFTLNPSVDNERNVIELGAKDNISGIDYYTLKIDSQSEQRIPISSIVDGHYTVPVQLEGEHNISVVAYDKVGNHTESKATIFSSKIIAPKISTDSEQISIGQQIEIQGRSSYDNANVTVYTEYSNNKIKIYNVKTDTDGSFNLLTEELKEGGEMNVWAELDFGNNIKSPKSNKLRVYVKDGLLVRTSRSLIYTMSFVVPASALLIILLAILYIGWYKFLKLRRKMDKQLQGVVDDVHGSMLLLKEEINSQLDKLEKVKIDRELNKKEEKIFKELGKRVEDIDEFIKKKIRKIK
jgi:hypothetical protein